LQSGRGRRNMVKSLQRNRHESHPCRNRLARARRRRLSACAGAVRRPLHGGARRHALQHCPALRRQRRRDRASERARRFAPDRAGPGADDSGQSRSGAGCEARRGATAADRDGLSHPGRESASAHCSPPIRASIRTRSRSAMPSGCRPAPPIRISPGSASAGRCWRRHRQLRSRAACRCARSAATAARRPSPTARTKTTRWACKRLPSRLFKRSCASRRS
jgi:hypothetical protein